jgi:hypothetical protein
MSDLARCGDAYGRSKKLGRVRVTGDRRKGCTSIDTLKANVDFTLRGQWERPGAERREGVVKVCRERPEEAETQEGIGRLQRVDPGAMQRIDKSV